MKLLHVMMLAAGLGLMPTQAHAAHTDLAGVGTWGAFSYDAVGDPVKFIAVEYRGDFTVADAHAVFSEAVQWVHNRNSGAQAGEQLFRHIAGDRYLVLAWWNERRTEGGWVAISSDRQNVWYMTNNNPQMRRADGWETRTWTTNGMQVGIQFALDAHGRGVAWGFHAPR